MAYQPRQYDPTNASWGKLLSEWRYEPDVGDFVRVVSYEVPQDTVFGLSDNAHPTGYSLIGQKVTNERNSNKIRVEELRYPNRLANGAPDPENDGVAAFPATWEETREVAELQEFVDWTVITTKMEPKEREGLVEEAHATWQFREELRQAGPYTRKRISWGPYGDEYLTRISYETDPTSGGKVRVTRNPVFSVLPPMIGQTAPGVSVAYKQVAVATWIREYREMLDKDGLPISGNAAFSSYTYYTRIQFTFPAYIRAFNTNPINGDIIRTLNKNQRRTITDVRIRTRREFTAGAWAKKIVSYHAADPVGSDMAVPGEQIFEWRYVDWKHDGALFRVNIERVIADETVINVTTLMNDTFYGAYLESVIFPASPGVTTMLYEEAIGYLKLVDIDVQQIENRIFRMVKTFVKMA